MKKANDISSELKIEQPESWSATYVYGDKYSNRFSHNPWTWWAEKEKKDVCPHFTIWADDVSADGLLSKFHITVNYLGQTHKPLHVYYSVNKSGKTKYTGMDAKRLGSDEQKGRDWADDKGWYFNKLAQEFVNKAVGA